MRVVLNALILCLIYIHIVPRVSWLVHLERDEINVKKAHCQSQNVFIKFTPDQISFFPVKTIMKKAL